MKLGSVAREKTRSGFLAEVRRRSGTNPADCYQCGKCTAGCPLTFAGDLDPARVMRLVQLGQRDAVLQSRTIWLCASCETCTTRCPQEVDLASVMDALRIMAREAGLTQAAREVAIANAGLLGSVKSRGRVHEMMLVLQQNLRTLHLFRDAEKGPVLMLKGKMDPLGHKRGARDQVRRLFENVARMEAAERAASTTPRCACSDEGGEA
ncbi:MAG: heterodisulfide reductase subunit C [Armatimonadetes bacterium]|nr:heterodisulfide reductase subunit C [Armatimonadota bacterium]